MILLALDTATLDAGVAVAELHGARVVPRAARSARVTTHSEALLAMVRDALAEAGCAPGDVGAVACGAGPGSFTGLRIGLATAKGLCLGLGRPLVLVSSLAALAARAPSGTVAVPTIDAYKGEVYAAFYRAGDPPLLDGDELVIAPDALAALVAARAATDEVHVIGDAPVRWPSLRVPGAVVVDHGPPHPLDVARVAAHRLARGEHDDLASAAPRYIRPSEAELHIKR